MENPNDCSAGGQAAKEKGLQLPFVQTIFSPLTTAKKLAGMRLFQDMRSHPDYVHQALKAITQTCIDFVAENLAAGVSGFFSPASALPATGLLKRNTGSLESDTICK